MLLVSVAVYFLELMECPAECAEPACQIRVKCFGVCLFFSSLRMKVVCVCVLLWP